MTAVNVLYLIDLSARALSEWKEPVWLDWAIIEWGFGNKFTLKK